MSEEDLTDFSGYNCIINQKTGRPACPLVSVEINAVIDGMLSMVTLVQHYVNVRSNSIEALYTFPLPFNAQVTGFRSTIGDIEVKGEFREKDEAFREYVKALKRGDTALLMESRRPDIFRVMLGNIKPDEKVTIEITYIEDTWIVDNELRWIVPTVIAPRYIPGSRISLGDNGLKLKKEEIVPEDGHIFPSVGEAPYTLKLNALVKGLVGIKKVSSPSHSIEIEFIDNDVRVLLSRETELLDSDFILSLLLDNNNESSYITASGISGEALGMVRLIMDPEKYGHGNESIQNNYSYIFMIDISGSMTGEKLKQAKRALIISLRNLINGDFFNIVAFENNFSFFSQSAVPYSQANLDKADKWIKELRASGGTEIYEPLRFVLEVIEHDDGLERILLLFTDGQVGNEKEIINLVKSNSNSLQLFPFGIDTAVNKYFIDSLASSGNGMPEYIYPGERIEGKVIRQFSRIHMPYLANPAVYDRNGAKLKTVPVMPARLYSCDIFSFMVKSESEETIREIKIKGHIDNENKEAAFKTQSAGDAVLMGMRWAKGRIEMLEEKIATSRPTSRINLLKQKIIELSLKYSILSTETSLVAVYERAVKTDGEPERIIVPVAKPRGWDMFDDTGDIMDVMASSVVNEDTMRFCPEDPEPGNIDVPIFIRRSTALSPAGIRPNNGKSGQAANSNQQICMDDIIIKAAQSQKADGTFGEGEETVRRTSFFITGMLMLGKEWKPYRIQIKKATEALISSSSKTGLLLKAAAFSKVLENGIIAGLKKEELQSIIDGIEKKLSKEKREAFKSFRKGDVILFCDLIGFDEIKKPDATELAIWLIAHSAE